MWSGHSCPLRMLTVQSRRNSRSTSPALDLSALYCSTSLLYVRRLHFYEQRDPHARVTQVIQEIIAVDIVYVDVIVVVPVCRPVIDQHERVPAILELRLFSNDYRTLRVECMGSPELRMEPFVRNVRALARGTSMLMVLARLLPPHFLVTRFFHLPLFIPVLFISRWSGLVLPRRLHLILLA